MANGGEGLDSETARILALERWSVSTQEERQEHMSKARGVYLSNRKAGLPSSEAPCRECHAKHGHKKGCSLYKDKELCLECKHNPHLKSCSHFKPWNLSTETRKKLSDVAKERPQEHNKKVSSTLKERWKDELFAESFTCSECGGRSNNHKGDCSLAPFCSECGSRGHSHKKGCSEYTSPEEFICPVCDQKIRNKGNLNQHIRARHPDYVG